jgi:hypothetical protein
LHALPGASASHVAPAPTAQPPGSDTAKSVKFARPSAMPGPAEPTGTGHPRTLMAKGGGCAGGAPPPSPPLAEMTACAESVKLKPPRSGAAAHAAPPPPPPPPSSSAAVRLTRSVTRAPARSAGQPRHARLALSAPLTTMSTAAAPASAPAASAPTARKST